MPKFAKQVPSERQPVPPRRPPGETWVWSSGGNRSKSGVGALRWKRIAARPETSATPAEAYDHDFPPAREAEPAKAPAKAPAAEREAPPEPVPAAAERKASESPPALTAKQTEAVSAAIKESGKYNSEDWPHKGKHSQQKWHPCGVGELSCPTGHALARSALALPFICSICGGEFIKGQYMWGCRKCDFDMCVACRHTAQKSALKGMDSPSMLSADSLESTQENSSTSGTVERDVANPSVSSGDEICWLGQTTCDAWSDEAQGLAQPDSGLSDETPIVGPEGQWFEGASLDGSSFDVGYSAQGLNPDGPHEGLICLSPVPFEGQHAVSSTKRGPERTSADMEIANMVAYMSKVALERYPARCRLFELVQEAATEALGDVFGRFALIGSTALGIDTPDSDLDAVVFTQQGEDEKCTSRAARGVVEMLRDVRALLAERDGTLQLQLVDCTRVPVLTVITADNKLSLDLTVDEPLGERHVLWFRSQAAAGLQLETQAAPTPIYKVPEPSPDAWAQGLEAAVLRCVKWWLRRRAIPVAKEGGYPSVVWTLMVLHVLRCSIFLTGMDNGENRGRSVLTAMAAFFDRFAECGLVGTFRFSGGRGAECWQQHLEDMTWPQMAVSELSVLDPTTTTCEEHGAWGQPMELAPRLSPATQLLHTHELRRAHWLSAAALCSNDPAGHEGVKAWSCGGGAALQQLFSEAGDTNVLPSAVPKQSKGVLVLSDGHLAFGVMRDVKPKPGWGASFLHRRDGHSRFLVQICEVEIETGLARERLDLHLQWFRPCDFVCMLPLRHGAQASGVYQLESDSLQRWCDMRMLVYGDANGDAMHRSSGTVRSGGGRGTGAGRRRNCRTQARA